MLFRSNTGTTANKYQYNGKEIQDDFGLYWYDYGARFYDPMVGRWHTIDPMAESYYSFSPFHFSGNNPMKFLDLNGMNYDWVEKAGGGELVWDDKVTSANDKDLQKGDKYLGKAVVVFGGSTDEKLGKGQNLFGEGAKLANVTVYGPDGADDVKTYKGFTMSSDFSKWGAVADGDYSVNYDDKGKSGALTSNWAVNARGKVPALGGINPSPYGEFDDSKVGIFIDRKSVV